jgi:anti-sigma factor RsiW
MNCEDVQSQLHDLVKRRLDPALRAEIGSHVESCASCGSAERAERALDELLEQRLTRYAAPIALKRRLGLLMGRPESASRAHARWTRAIAPAMAAGFALLAAGVVLQRSSSPGSELASLTSEAVNDHLRVLASQHPVEIESGGMHQVKPWFEGKLDFAPVVPAPEGSELQLRGGSVGYVFDRKAAVLVYGLRLHVVTLLVFRPEGLAWPDAGARQIGTVRGSETSTRGFNVVLWQDGGLGYVLVSDVNAEELTELAARLAAATVEKQPQR